MWYRQWRMGRQFFASFAMKKPLRLFLTGMLVCTDYGSRITGTIGYLQGCVRLGEHHLFEVVVEVVFDKGVSYIKSILFPINT